MAAIERMRIGSKALAMALGLLCGATATASATRLPAPRKNLSFVFPRDRQPDPIERTLSALRKYNTEEANLAKEEGSSRTLLMSHWKRLDLIAANLEQLDHFGQLGSLAPPRWQALRHEIAELFTGTPEVIDLPGQKIDQRLAAADLRRKQNLIRIALVGNRRFGLGIREVFGFAVDAGVS
jgi:hypothetical protein